MDERPAFLKDRGSFRDDRAPDGLKCNLVEWRSEVGRCVVRRRVCMYSRCMRGASVVKCIVEEGDEHSQLLNCLLCLTGLGTKVVFVM